MAQSKWGTKDQAEKSSKFWGDKAETTEEVKAKKAEPKPKAVTIDEVGKWLMTTENPNGTSCILLYGSDGTGKSGLSQATPLRGKGKMVIFDLDRSNMPIWEAYHNCDPNIIIKDPVVMGFDEDGNYTIDYLATMNRIKASLIWVKDNHEKHKVTVVVLDGLNKLLKYAEYQMRIDANVQVDGGVSMRYWIRRSKAFMEILEVLKGLPVHKIYVAHEDFQVKEGEAAAAVKANTNQLMDVKCFLERKDYDDQIEFYGTVDKHKSNSAFEGKEIKFMTVDKKTGQSTWNSDEMWSVLGWRPDSQTQKPKPKKKK